MFLAEKVVDQKKRFVLYNLSPKDRKKAKKSGYTIPMIAGWLLSDSIQNLDPAKVDQDIGTSILINITGVKDVKSPLAVGVFCDSMEDEDLFRQAVEEGKLYELEMLN